MLYSLLIIGLILLILWVVGLITSFTLSGGIHILFVIGVVFLIIGLIKFIIRQSNK